MGNATKLLKAAVVVIGVTLIGIAFFFSIIGVFGMAESIVGLVLFLAIAVVIFSRRKSGATPL